LIAGSGIKKTRSGAKGDSPKRRTDDGPFHFGIVRMGDVCVKGRSGEKQVKGAREQRGSVVKTGGIEGEKGKRSAKGDRSSGEHLARDLQFIAREFRGVLKRGAGAGVCVDRGCPDENKGTETVKARARAREGRIEMGSVFQKGNWA
jgi:hypothetical protein